LPWREGVNAHGREGTFNDFHNWRNASRKSWPQWLMQWALVDHEKNERAADSKSWIMPSFCSRSGDKVLKH
jgi:hypothetical protein